MSVREVGWPRPDPSWLHAAGLAVQVTGPSHWGQRGQVTGPQHPCGGSVEAPEQGRGRPWSWRESRGPGT